MTAQSPNASTAIVRYAPLEADIAAFLQKHENVVHDVATTKGMDLAKKDRAECRGIRLRIEEARVAEKKDALEYGRKVDSEAKRLTSIITPAEEAYDAQIKHREQQLEAERQAKIDAERNRVANIRAMIDGMKQSAGAAIGETADEVAERIKLLVGIDPAEKAHAYLEFHTEAVNAHAATLDFLRELHEKKVRAEAEAEQLRKDREQLERDKVAQAQRDHEAKIAREAQKRADQEARDEAARKERIAQDARDRTAREELERQQAANAAEQKRLDEQKREQDAAQARIDAESQRQAQAKRDEDARAAAAKERKADEERQRIAAKKKADELAKMLKQAKRPTAGAALAWIAEIASDDTVSDTEARKQIQVIAIANTPKDAAKAAEAEQAQVRA